MRAIVERSLSDRNFRALALADPASAIQSVTRTPVPESFRVRFVDNAGYDMTVVLPDVPAAKVRTETLSDAEIAEVAGGTLGGFSLGGCPAYTAGCPTFNQLTACNPGYTKKPGSPAFCPR